jgi:acyl-CoA dehydrogenase
MTALEDPDRARGLEHFDQAFWGHVGHSITNGFRAWGRAWTGGLFAPAADAGGEPLLPAARRYASAFALAVDVALLALGGALKRQEMISARFGDVLSELYLLSAVLKRWRTRAARRPICRWWRGACRAASPPSRRGSTRSSPISQPAGGVAAALSAAAVRRAPPRAVRPADAGLRRDPAQPSAARDRLTVDIFHGIGDDGVARLERAFALVTAAEPLRDRLHKAARARRRESARAGVDQRGRGGSTACRRGGGGRRRGGR